MPRLARLVEDGDDEDADDGHPALPGPSPPQNHSGAHEHVHARLAAFLLHAVLLFSRHDVVFDVAVDGDDAHGVHDGAGAEGARDVGHLDDEAGQEGPREAAQVLEGHEGSELSRTTTFVRCLGHVAV